MGDDKTYRYACEICDWRGRYLWGPDATTEADNEWRLHAHLHEPRFRIEEVSDG